MIVNRKIKKLEFTVNQNKIDTNITIKKKSNHRKSAKTGVVTRYAGRAKGLYVILYI